jgi:diketogulonate reductase-like aldo/keto reductase
VRTALDLGYRHIDTAAYYGNEESVGKAIRDSGIAREQIFVTTKLWNSHHGDPERALAGSLRRLAIDYIDLYLIHYPVSERLRSWKLFESFKKRDATRSIGVSNFTIRHLKELHAASATIAAVNQVEFHPYLYQRELLEFCRSQNIALEAYSPLTHGARLKDPKLLALAKKYSKSAAQILIRWALQHDTIVIPKSANPSRIAEDADVFDFEICAPDMQLLDSFNENLRTCWDPTHAP